MINSPKFDSDITMNGLKSLDTNDKISKEFHQDGEKASMKIVFHSNKNDGLNNKDTKDIEDAFGQYQTNDDYIQISLIHMTVVRLMMKAILLSLT